MLKNNKKPIYSRFLNPKMIKFNINNKFVFVVYFTISLFIFDNLKYFFYNDWSRLNSSFLFLSKPSLLLLIILIITSCLLIFIKNNTSIALIFGLLYGLSGYIFSLFANTSIILVVWHGILGAIMASAFILNDLLVYSKLKILSTEKRDDLLIIKSDSLEILKLTIQGFLSLAAITGVCMSILFKDNFNSVELKLDAIWMVTAFGFCAGSIGIWIIFPVYQIFKTVNQKVFSLKI